MPEILNDTEIKELIYHYGLTGDKIAEVIRILRIKRD